MFEKFQFKKGREDWEAKAIKEIKGKEISSLFIETGAGELIQPYYKKEDVAKTGHVITSSVPVKLRQNIRVGEEGSSNKEILGLLNDGVQAIGLELDVFTSVDFKKLFKDIVQEYIDLHFILQEEAFNQLTDFSFLDKASSGSFEFSITKIDRLNDKAFTKLPSHIRFIQLTDEGSHSEIGAIATMLGQAKEYINFFMEKGFSIDQIANRFDVHLHISTNFFESIAYVRAFRVCWNALIHAYAPSHSCTHYIHITAHYKANLYEKGEDVYSNVLRQTTQLISAISGNVDAITIVPFHLGTESAIDASFAQRISRNIVHILKEESTLGQVQDPASGAYYMEKLTEQYVQKAWNAFIAS